LIDRYVLREHVGPFLFALSATTSLMLLQYIARKFGDLVGKGLDWKVITEFILLSIPVTLELTVPMAFLVAVLSAFSRLAAENEIMALSAGGVSPRALTRPALAVGVVLAFFMLWFNDQVVSPANHELVALSTAILQTKPTFALKSQVLNTVKEGELYLRAGRVDQDASGGLHDVTIYNLADVAHRRTIYATDGVLAFAENQKDLVLDLSNGMVMWTPSTPAGQLDRLYFERDRFRVRGVGNSFHLIDADTTSKGDREMSICEMQTALERADLSLQRALRDSIMAAWQLGESQGRHEPQPPSVAPRRARGIGRLYCDLAGKMSARMTRAGRK
jgi:lipopolysaccharide export system permease protein